MLCYDIDDETLHLVLQMHMEDLEELKQNSKGKHREDELPDADFAIDMYRSEIESRALFASDRSMCKSIAQANRRDGQLVSAIVEEEQQAANDRAFAVWLSREDPFFQENEDVTPSPPPRQPPPAPPPGPPPAAGGQYNPSSNDAFLRKLQIMYMDTGAGDEDEDVNMLNQPESSSWGGSRPRSKSRSHAVSRGKRRCNSCLNDLDFTDVARCPCNHEYCRDCLRTLFETAITDEALFPPRCCGQHIPVEENRVFLSPELIGRFRARELELSTQDKTYCHGPTCSQFIPKEFIKDSIATCQRCRRRTCTTCKGVEHRNEDCPEDESTQSVLQVADENQWQQCRQCNRLVELAHGCYHITCRCGYQFCYICSARWKTCSCPQWEENRLIARANAIVHRDPNAPNLNPQRLARRVERTARNLSRNHECRHTTWGIRRGQFDCEECHETKNFFINECTRCRIHVCRGCRYNRLRQQN